MSGINTGRGFGGMVLVTTVASWRFGSVPATTTRSPPSHGTSVLLSPRLRLVDRHSLMNGSLLTTDLAAITETNGARSWPLAGKTLSGASRGVDWAERRRRPFTPSVSVIEVRSPRPRAP